MSENATTLSEVVVVCVGESLTIAQYGATVLSSIFGYNQSFTAFLDIISAILVFFVCILYICMYLYYLNLLLVLLSIDELIEPKRWQRMASNMKTFNIKSLIVSQNISGKNHQKVSKIILIKSWRDELVLAYLYLEKICQVKSTLAYNHHFGIYWAPIKWPHPRKTGYRNVILTMAPKCCTH